MEKIVSQDQKYQIINELTPDMLFELQGKAIYTKSEFKYLTRFNPFAFRDISSFSQEEALNDLKVSQSIRMAMFSLIVTMDAAVCYGSVDHKYLTQEKLPFINPYLSVLGLEEFKHQKGDNPILSVWKTRMSGLQVLSLLSDLDWELDDETFLIEKTNRFKNIYKRVSKVISKDDIAVVYGSSINSKTPNDVDVLILQKELDFISYEKMMNWAIRDNYSPKISLQVIPVDLLDSFLASDPFDILVPENAVILNKGQDLIVNKVSEKHRSEMCKYRVGYQLARARNTLTERFFKFYLNSEAKTRSELKQAKFTRRNLMRAFKVDIPEVNIIEPWKKTDGASNLRNSLVELNIQLSKQFEYLDMKGYIQAPDTVTIQLQNLSGKDVDLGYGKWNK